MVGPTSDYRRTPRPFGEPMKTSFSAQERRALTDAAEALRTVVRLETIKSGGVTSLTANQSRDFDTAVRSYNETRNALAELPTLGSEFTDLDLDAAVRAVSNMTKLDEMATRASIATAQLRSIGIGTSDSETGIGEARTADPIRDMITAGERQHTFDFLESEQIRALPWDDTDNTRAISDFANGTSLYVSDFAARVAMYARTGSPWLALGTVRTSDNGRPLIVPTLTGDVTVYTPGEGTAITASDPTLGTVTVTPTGFKALTYINREAFDDEDVSLTDILARSHARAIGLAFGSAFTGTVLSGITNGGTAVPAGGSGTGTPTFVGYEDLIDLEYGRAAPYREAGVWVFANGMIKKARKYKDGQGNYLWQPSLSAAGPQSLDGNAVYEDPYLAAPASATKSAVFGDLGAALIIKATPIRVEMSTDFLFNTDQVAIKSVQRISGAVQDSAAAAYLVSYNV